MALYELKMNHLFYIQECTVKEIKTINV